ncbi:maturation protein [ssRNA phage Gerhypos.4_26]|uniref:Maturation protein n=2 Tax=Leviviricetes TaxID=2842243 RepID=A0A8S5L2T3_9VIRU|nr:maturation protein [ssRNA phage Gerhypos.4_26]QDH89464.1 MAG: hypothetical protein H4Bulk46544_000004 [Leviviridae sp.]DAD51669.1 TPA_asm: maturation protein [ssRNA phage Gerhypos.4_26]
MSSAGKRERTLYEDRLVGVEITPSEWEANGGNAPSLTTLSTGIGKQVTVSESHPMDRSTGSYREGGPFFTSLVRDFLKAGYIENNFDFATNRYYTGPVAGLFPTLKEKEEVGYTNVSGSFGDKNESQMTKDGTTAISLCSPTNPASDLGTSLAETFREGVPSLPGIQLWRNKTKILKDLGSEYLNYQFGWAPLKDEVSSVVDAARNHRDIMKAYQRGEGSDTHRRFDFPSDSTYNSLVETAPIHWYGLNASAGSGGGTRQVSLVRETKKWFEGSFTYALPSSADNWRKALGFGSDADRLFGLALSPDILWELTPWSWAVDWFSNAGEVINNVTNFGLAGLVLRYGYMMEESIERITAEGRCPDLGSWSIAHNKRGELEAVVKSVSPGSYSCGTECITKRRVPASPFGFGIGWEGLSPTQLAITAALGITRLL